MEHAGLFEGLAEVDVGMVERRAVARLAEEDIAVVEVLVQQSTHRQPVQIGERSREVLTDVRERQRATSENAAGPLLLVLLQLPVPRAA